MRRGMATIERRQCSAGVEEMLQIRACVFRNVSGAMLSGAGGTERSAVARTELQGPGRDGDSVEYTSFERRRESQDGHLAPEQPQPERFHRLG